MPEQRANIIKPLRPVWRRAASHAWLNKLAAPHGIGGYLESINPMLSLDADAVKAKVVALRQETPQATRIALRPNGEWRGFQPGQFITLNLDLNGRSVSRCYSLCGEVDAATLEITVKETANGYMSKAVNHGLRVGDIVTISQAQGDFVLAEESPPALLLLAAGSGITPVFSLLQQMLRDCPQTPTFMLLYNRSPGEAIFLSRLQAMADSQPYFNLQCFYSANDQRLSARHIRPLELPNGFQSYVCGPSGFIDKAQRLLAKDKAAGDVFSERFGAPAQKQPSRKDKALGDVSFALSERYVPNNGETLLEQAEAAGLTPQAGCRMGICHTCTCQKTSGAVRNTLSGEVTHGVEEIRICVSQPLGDVTLDI